MATGLGEGYLWIHTSYTLLYKLTLCVLFVAEGMGIYKRHLSQTVLYAFAQSLHHEQDVV